MSSPLTRFDKVESSRNAEPKGRANMFEITAEDISALKRRGPPVFGGAPV